MEVNISGLKCDHCEYRDDNIKFSEYFYYIDRPCPDCGESLLTEAEFQDCLKIYAKVTTYNKIMRVLRWLNPIHYWRLVFGDKRKEITLTKVYTNKCLCELNAEGKNIIGHCSKHHTDWL